MEPVKKVEPIGPEMLRTTTKPAVKSKEWWGRIVSVIGAILGVFGIIGEPDFLRDGWQETDLAPLIGFLLLIVGQAWEKYGARAAKDAVSGLFKNKG